jgi:hypothetical protein
VPVCTSDVFLRWAVPAQDPEIFRTSYAAMRPWASPAQGDALDELSQSLSLAGDNRLGDAYQRMLAGGRRGGRGRGFWAAGQQYNGVREELRQWLLERWPDLKQHGSRGYKTARTEAIAELDRRARDGRLHDLFAADDALTQAEENGYQAELAQARVLRFCRLAKSVILAHRLRESGDSATRNRFERLINDEAGSPITPAPAPAEQQALLKR